MKTMHNVWRAILVLEILLAFSAPVWANTPGQHSVTLTWTNNCTGTVPCTFNLYRGTAAGVCSGTPTPYVKGIANPTFTDTANLTDGATIFYNVSAVRNGGESACNGELQVQIPILPPPPSGLSGTAQ